MKITCPRWSHALAFVLAAFAPFAMSAPAGTARTYIDKPDSPIAIRYEIAGQPALGRALEISVIVGSTLPLDDVVLSFGASQGLVVDTALSALRVERIEAGEIHEATVSVTPLVLDILDLSVTVEADVGGTRQASTVLVPIRLAPTKSRVAAALKPDAAATEARVVVHSLRAIESPSGRLR
jgi:hypothetical protein